MAKYFQNISSADNKIAKKSCLDRSINLLILGLGLFILLLIIYAIFGSARSVDPTGALVGFGFLFVGPFIIVLAILIVVKIILYLFSNKAQ